MDESIIYGIHAVHAALTRRSLTHVWLQKNRKNNKLKNIIDEISHQDIPCERVSKNELDALTDTAVHQGIVAKARLAVAGNEQTLDTILDGLNKPPFLLILDGVQDPRNLGACLRSAAAAGVDAVIAPKDRAASLTPATRKVASGAAEIVPFIQVTNLVRTLRELQARGIWIVGLAGEAEQPLYEVDLAGALAIVSGAEGNGLRRLTREHCDFLARIPMTDAVESLNVSVSAGIALFEAVRQRSMA